MGHRVGQGVSRGMVPAMAFGSDRRYIRGDPLAHAARGVGLVMGDRGKYCRYVGRGRLGEGEWGAMRIRVRLQRGGPLRGVLGGAPRGAAQAPRRQLPRMSAGHARRGVPDAGLGE